MVGLVGFVCVALAAGTGTVIAQAPEMPPEAVAQEPVGLSLNDALDRGVAAFREGRYDAAATHFQRAMAIDPGSVRARMYLGTVYAYQVVPNLDTPENLALSDRAIALFRGIPETEPDHLQALKQIASLLRDTRRLDEAKQEDLRVLQLKPDDAETHYTIGVVDWQQSYGIARIALAHAGLTDDGMGNIKLAAKECLALRAQNAALVKDGLEHLGRAIELNPNYDDAMQYMNLTLRRDADLACGDAGRRESDMAQATKWSEEAMRTRTRNEALPTTPK